MTTAEIQKLINLVIKAVHGADGKTWHERRDAILAEAGDDEKEALAEFGSWFSDDY